MLTYRIAWIDAAKGFAILLVVYGHNNPGISAYIYSFHMPLFFVVAGFFHPVSGQFSDFWKGVKKRWNQLVIPYYLWAIVLFIFWYFLGRHYGRSLELNLTVYDNLVGVLVAQGGRRQMDWGMPLWFLPCMFVVVLLYSGLLLIQKKHWRWLLISAGLGLGLFLQDQLSWYFWSFDVALIALFYYAMGALLFQQFQYNSRRFILGMCLASGLLHLLLFHWNGPVDMFRSNYGNSFFLFLINGLLGSIFFISIFKYIPKIAPLQYLGKHTIPILALQLRCITLIKAVLLFGFGVQQFRADTEIEKLILTLVQILLMLPLLYGIQKFFPIFNGNYGKRRSRSSREIN